MEFAKAADLLKLQAVLAGRLTVWQAQGDVLRRCIHCQLLGLRSLDLT